MSLPQAVHQTTGLPAPGKGKGNTPADQRDPKRVWTKTERQEQLDKQNGKCAQCGAEKTVDETQGHHIVRQLPAPADFKMSCSCEADCNVWRDEQSLLFKSLKCER